MSWYFTGFRWFFCQRIMPAFMNRNYTSNSHRHHPSPTRQCGPYARAFQLIDESLAQNSNECRLERKLWLRRQAMRQAYYASAKKVKVSQGKSSF